MGRKADALQQELDIVAAELDAAQEENRRLRALVGTMPPAAIVAAAASTPVAAFDSTAAQPEPPEEHPVVRDAREAIAELRNPSPMPEKTESLAEIVRHNNWEREQLQNNQRASNTLISRVASALQVPRWDGDGSEILEKAQRFSVFQHFLSKRLKAIVSTIPENTTVPESREEIARMHELRAIISALVAPPQLSKFLHEKSPAKVTPGIFDTALAGAEESIAPTIRRTDILAMRDAWAVYAAEKNLQTEIPWLVAVARSEVAMTELLDLLNLILVPTLMRHKLWKV